MREGTRERGNVEYERIEEERVWALQGAFQGALRGSRGRQPFLNVYVHRVCRQGFWHMLRTASALKTDLRVLAMMQTFRNTGVGVLNL